MTTTFDNTTTLNRPYRYMKEYFRKLTLMVLLGMSLGALCALIDEVMIGALK